MLVTSIPFNFSKTNDTSSGVKFFLEKRRKKMRKSRKERNRERKEMRNRERRGKFKGIEKKERK